MPFTVLCNTDIQVSTSILVYSVVIDAKECVVGGEEAVLWDVALGRMKSCGAPIGVDTWRGEGPNRSVGLDQVIGSEEVGVVARPRRHSHGGFQSGCPPQRQAPHG